MKSGRVLIAAVFFLGAGLWVLFEYCNGNAGMNFGSELSANKVSIDLTTSGVPMLVGFPLAGMGLLLMLIAFIGAIVGQFRRPREVEGKEISARREAPFEEVDPE
jgi:hypothetical protein